MTCDSCGKEIIVGITAGIPNIIGLELEDGTLLNVCQECIVNQKLPKDLEDLES